MLRCRPSSCDTPVGLLAGDVSCGTRACRARPCRPPRSSQVRLPSHPARMRRPWIPRVAGHPVHPLAGPASAVDAARTPTAADAPSRRRTRTKCGVRARLPRAHAAARPRRGVGARCRRRGHPAPASAAASPSAPAPAPVSAPAAGTLHRPAQATAAATVPARAAATLADCSRSTATTPAAAGQSASATAARLRPHRLGWPRRRHRLRSASVAAPRSTAPNHTGSGTRIGRACGQVLRRRAGVAGCAGRAARVARRRHRPDRVPSTAGDGRDLPRQGGDAAPIRTGRRHLSHRRGR